MYVLEIKKDIFWIGAIDFNKRNFHGYSQSPLGTTYNAYLIKDQKNVIMDTVACDYAEVMLQRLVRVLPPENVDYFVINHTEKDHAGALPILFERCRPEKIFISAMGKKFLEAQFDTSAWPLQVVKTGDSVNIGSRSIHFVETPMLHWPDSMMAYIPENKLLISNDAFGQNIASTERFSDQVNSAYLLAAVKEYFYNIILPFSPLVLKTLDSLETMQLDIDMIAPDHGLILRGRDQVTNMLTIYRELAGQKTPCRALILYDTMWHSTERMADAIAEGFDAEGVPYRIMQRSMAHHSQVMTEMADCGAFVAGSPTHNNNMLPGLSEVLTYMKGLRPRNRIGAAFGSYGWSGEAPGLIHDWLLSMEMEMPVKPLKLRFVPKHEDLCQCHDLGVTVAKALKAKSGEALI